MNPPILQSFLVKTNLTINLLNLVEKLDINSESTRTGSIIALKYKNIIKGKEDLFKSGFCFKNACHLIVHHTVLKRKKKLIKIKITNIGTFQIIGIPEVDVEKIVYKLYTLMEKLNKNYDVFVPKLANEYCRLEMVIIPILNNFILDLDKETTKRIFQNSKDKIIQKFIDNKFFSFYLPGDVAISIKKPYSFEDFNNHPIKYITHSKNCGKLVKVIEYIAYSSYLTLLEGEQLENAMKKKFLTCRLFSTGKILVSGFTEHLIQKDVEEILKVCNSF